MDLSAGFGEWEVCGKCGLVFVKPALRTCNSQTKKLLKGRAFFGVQVNEQISIQIKKLKIYFLCGWHRVAYILAFYNQSYGLNVWMLPLGVVGINVCEGCLFF